MPNYSKITDKANNRKIQVESAVRDGEGNKISTRYITSDGYYPQLGAGFADLADNLTPYSDNSAISQEHSFVFQSTGDSSDVGSYSLLKELKGNTIIFNQLCIVPTVLSGETNGITIANNEDGSVAFSGTASADTTIVLMGNLSRIIPVGHKVLISNFKNPNHSTYYIFDAYENGQTQSQFDTPYGYVHTVQTSSNVLSPRAFIKSGATINETIYIMYFDLTTMFGAGNEPTNVLEFNRLSPLPYYDFNVGQLLSSKSNKLINVGFNAFDINNPTDFIKVIAGETYSIENTSGGSISEYDGSQTLIKTTNVSDLSVAESGTPYIVLTDNTHYVKINDYTSTTCLHLTWNNERDGEFEEYVKYEYDLPDVELRSAGNVYDSITPDGTHTIRVGTYTFTGEESGTIVNTDSETGYVTVRFAVLNNRAVVGKNIICPVADAGSYNSYVYTHPYTVFVASTSSIDINLAETDVAGTLAKLTGKTINFELATPTTEQVSSYAERQNINDFGTQEFVSSQAIQVPQGNLFSYPVDYKAFVDSLGSREDIDYNASQIVSHEELTEALSDIDLSDYAKIDQAFNVINASDIVNNILTQAQYDLITNGKPTLIQDSNANDTHILFTYHDYGNYIHCLAFYRNSISNVEIIKTNLSINMTYANETNGIGIGDGKIAIRKLASVNGKTIPNYPSNTGTFVLKCVNGALTWVQE